MAALERLYGHRDGELGAWLAAFNRAAYPLLHEGCPVGIMLFDLERVHVFEVEGLSPEQMQPFRAFADDAIESTLTPEYFASTMRGPQMVELWSQLGVDFAPSRGFMERMAAVDMLGLTTEPLPSLGLVLSAGVAEPRTLGATERAWLTRIALHLETTARARLQPDSVIGTVSLDGRFELDARIPSRAARDEVREQVGAIEQLRTARQRQDGERALLVWKALTRGSLSLLERIDTDGKRFYQLCENPPWRQSLRALGAREALVVAQATRGLSNKEIAFALGLSPPYVSRLLGTAAGKLGLPTARSLLHVASLLLAPPEVDAAQLTPIERDVLRLLAAGHSNRQIAERRGVASRTVANQVASVLAKTGAGSRRALLGRTTT